MGIVVDVNVVAGTAGVGEVEVAFGDSPLIVDDDDAEVPPVAVVEDGDGGGIDGDGDDAIVVVRACWQTLSILTNVDSSCKSPPF